MPEKCKVNHNNHFQNNPRFILITLCAKPIIYLQHVELIVIIFLYFYIIFSILTLIYLTSTIKKLICLHRLMVQHSSDH